MIKESTPDGKSNHELGAKADAGKSKCSLLIQDFPDALLAVAEVATFGADKYTRHGWHSVSDGENRYTDAMIRHMLTVEDNDKDSKLLHAAHLAWNALARLQLIIERLENEKEISDNDVNRYHHNICL